MSFFIRKLRINLHPELYKLSLQSKNMLLQNKQENVLKSNTLKKLLSDEFQYTGSKINRICVLGPNNKPVELKVEYHCSEIAKDYYKENWFLFDKNNKLVGKKCYYIKDIFSNSPKMEQGTMSNISSLKGVGSRLDQIQIERALQLGIKNIPRTSRSNATLYHTKMGFLPVEKELERIKSLYSLNRLVKSVKHIWGNYIPIILEKNGKFFLDINTSQYMMNLNKCKEIIKKHNKNRIDNLDGNNTILSLSGEQLKYWKEMIKGHTILDKLKFDYPETILDKLKR